MTEQEQIAYNQKVHDQVAQKYEQVHPEIFNDIEQTRLKKALNLAKDSITSDSVPYTALDVGCGSGNLSRYLVGIGFQVTSADVSSDFLKRISVTIPEATVFQLNGLDLREIPDQSFDCVATYSVLHHIPDYLRMVEEMCRVLKPGGVLYIDHEKNEKFWSNDAVLQEFYAKQRSNLTKANLRKLLQPMWYIHRYRRLHNPRYQAEGDIHVWSDDHIEWGEVKKLCEQNGLEVVSEMDFLGFDARYDREVYEMYTDKTNDTKAVIFKKL